MKIAIDGTSASGKGMLGKMIAEKYGLAHLDTGKIYRYTAWMLAQESEGQTIDIVSEEFLQRVVQSLSNRDIADFLAKIDEELIKNEISIIASKISTIAQVRSALYDAQRNFVDTHKDVILDGRDIATRIMPEADIKFYVDADVEVRAWRRLKQLGLNDNYLSKIVDDIKARDKRDKERDLDPLRPVVDSIIIDNSADIDSVWNKITLHIGQFLQQGVSTPCYKHKK